jgi:hypothetical protein
MSQPFNYGIVRSYGHVWDEATQTWIPQVQPGESAGATTVLVPDGSDTTQGSTGDVGVTTDAPGTVSGKLRGLVTLLRSLVTLLTSVWDGGTHLRVDGSSVVQPISAANLDVALSTRLKPADTLTKVSTVDTITNPVAVTGTFYQATQPVSGPLTDTALRASPVPVSGPLTDAALRASALPVSGPVTDTQLRASAVPVSLASLPNSSNLDVALSTRLAPADTLTKVSTVDTITNPVAVTGTFYPVTQPVSGPVTDTQLRASAVPVSLTTLPNPSNLDAAVSTLLKPADTLTKVGSVDTITNPVAVTGTFYPATQPVSGPVTDTQLRASAVPVSVVSLPLPSSAAVEAGGNLEMLMNISGALLVEVRLLRQAFQDWSGAQPRYDPRYDPDKYEVN